MGDSAERWQIFLTIMIVGYKMLVSSKTPEEIDFNNRDVLKDVIVHLDFKQLSPKLSYFTSLLKDMKKFGANGLLLEYEQKFPFKGELKVLSNHDAFDSNMLTEFLKQAVKEGFQLIPLVQTFGHMDYVLKYFQNVSEYRDSSESICPSKTKSIYLLKDILKQIITYHKNIAPLKYFHIGYSEVNYGNLCADCKRRNLELVEIFSAHIKQMRDFIRSFSANTKVLIWDDLYKSQECAPFTYGVQPIYTQFKYLDKLEDQKLLRYQKYFGGIWVATAFKGADEESALFPDLPNRFDNHYYLIKTINDLILEERYYFQGIILTGWSRNLKDPEYYSELLTSSIPSLYLNLLVIQLFKNMYKKFQILTRCSFKKFDREIDKYVLVTLKKKLNCDNMKENVIDNSYYKNCRYPGSEVNIALSGFVRELIQRDRFEEVKLKLWKTMSEYYDDFVVQEYIYHVESFNKPLS